MAGMGGKLTLALLEGAIGCCCAKLFYQGSPNGNLLIRFAASRVVFIG